MTPDEQPRWLDDLPWVTSEPIFEALLLERMREGLRQWGAEE